ncbi:MAG TPA: TraR/DksA family transcriptional regulator [Candidatus Omnitrophota bacterium]|nr:TraR/DksA family transcriptional regulator [Candidatus Omnitrophota bacterium]
MSDIAQEQKILEELKTKLVERHKELSGEMISHRKELRDEASPEDAAQIREDAEMLEEESFLEEQEIHLIEEAVQRIADGSYGQCLDCKNRIPVARLRVLPYAKFCVPCETKRERTKK